MVFQDSLNSSMMRMRMRIIPKSTADVQEAQLTSIILADSEAIFTTGIARILAAQEEIHVMAQCMDSDQLLSAIAEFPGSIVLFAPSLVPDLKHMFGRLEAVGSRGVVIADSNASPIAYLHQGFRGVAFREITSKALVECIRRVAAGGTWQPPLPAWSVSPESDIPGTMACERLNFKEMSIVALVVQGLRTPEIAGRLNITEPSVKSYLRSIYMKFGVSDRLDLAMFTMRHPALMQALAEIGKTTEPPCQVAEDDEEVA